MVRHRDDIGVVQGRRQRPSPSASRRRRWRRDATARCGSRFRDGRRSRRSRRTDDEVFFVGRIGRGWTRLERLTVGDRQVRSAVSGHVIGDRRGSDGECEKDAGGIVDGSDVAVARRRPAAGERTSTSVAVGQRHRLQPPEKRRRRRRRQLIADRSGVGDLTLLGDAT